MTPAISSASPATDGQPSMERKPLLRGVLGALAGLLAFVFSRIFAEPRSKRPLTTEPVGSRIMSAWGTH